jgi:monoterpene epsilon-lactone hydrolase
MTDKQNQAPFTLNGRWQYRWRSLFALYQSMLYISARRLMRGPRFPNWSWALEMSTHFLKAQAAAAFDMPNIADGREYEDAFVFGSPAVAQVTIESINQPIKGHWYQPRSGARPVTLLYLHGGGYAYYSKAHENLIALVTLAAESRTFALDYRLTPEHPYPAQLEDALAAYRWLLDTGVAPERLVVAGDSAGGNLTLALLLSLRDAHLPLPALAIGLAPWTDFANSGESMIKNEAYDWIEKCMADRWAEWYCKGADVRNPLVSPIHADFSGLPPIYLQAGSAEILHVMIRALADRAQQQGARVTLEVWPNMTHDFQAFGALIPESQAALRRIGEVVKQHIA